MTLSKSLVLMLLLAFLAQRRLDADVRECSVSSFAKAAAADTTALSRVDLSADGIQGSEGTELTGFYSDGILRVLSMTLYGAAGVEVTRIWVVDSTTYLLESEVRVFAGFTSDEARPLVGRLLASQYVCKGVVGPSNVDNEIGATRVAARLVRTLYRR